MQEQEEPIRKRRSPYLPDECIDSFPPEVMTAYNKDQAAKAATKVKEQPELSDKDNAKIKK